MTREAEEPRERPKAGGRQLAVVAVALVAFVAFMVVVAAVVGSDSGTRGL